MSTLQNSLLPFFMAHAPFDRFDRAHLEWLVDRLALNYYPRGEVLAEPGRGEAQQFFIIKQGCVQGRRKDDDQEAAFELHEGETFPVGALLAARAVTSIYRAAEDVFCFELSAADFRELLEMSSVFKDFCTRRIAALFDQSTQAMQAQLAQAAKEQQSLSSTLADILRRAPITCRPETPLREVLTTMRELHVGSMIAVDDGNRPVGIFTLHDLLGRVVLSGVSIDQPIADVMSRDPVSLPPTAHAYEAAMVMARAGFRHVLVTETDGRLRGILSERDLFALQRVGLRQLSGALRQADNIEVLVALSKDIRALTRNMMAQGVAADQLTLFVSTLNDLLAERVIALETTAAGLDQGPLKDRLCWLVMGSGGRLEQTLNTDQDNALLFTVPEGMTADQVRTQLLPVALRVNHALARCGFPLCKGEIMASNPQWCLSMTEWKQVFSGWVMHGTPEALLHASIFFDFRALHGNHWLAEELRGWLLRVASDNSRFLYQMAENAMRNRPPLGVVRDFVVGKERTIDLKVNGITPFVDAARIFSFAAGISHTNTLQRLRLSGPKLNVHPSEIEAWINAFLFIQVLRLRRHHESIERGVTPDELDNHIDPEKLNELDRRILKESFRQARKLQARLALEYHL